MRSANGSSAEEDDCDTCWLWAGKKKEKEKQEDRFHFCLNETDGTGVCVSVREVPYQTRKTPYHTITVRHTQHRTWGYSMPVTSVCVQLQNCCSHLPKEFPALLRLYASLLMAHNDAC